ncbi:hypothetical protein [Mycolicibacterium litorale]|uniref:hypothetical protein n=1 Tax=Mycolicibacterium litorale TaxID=758802 RepID=UPI0016272206|nr:hypothetical protein [Mycolicibacterium litorale]
MFRAALCVLAALGGLVALAPDARTHTLFIVNYPDQRHDQAQGAAGQINANVATAKVYGSVIRESGVCAGA